jgi:hypothetical protein
LQVKKAQPVKTAQMVKLDNDAAQLPPPMMRVERKQNKTIRAKRRT